MILTNVPVSVLKRYTDRDFVGGPTVEVAVEPDRFVMCIGGDDYYAQEEWLDRTQARVLRGLLDEFLTE